MRSAAAVLLLALVATGEARGIVTRHDREDARYLELAGRFPAAVTLEPDGAGTLVGKQWVLTAAHIAELSKETELHALVADARIAVSRVVFHPQWTGSGPHDVALLELERPLRQAAPAGLFEGRDEIGREVFFVGSGDTGDGLTGPDRADGKRRAATNTVIAVDSDWVYFVFDAPGDEPGADPGEATDLEGVSGPGDSGGPALVRQDGRLYVLGVSSHAVGKDGPGRYGVREVYTRVSTHAGWIRDVMAGKLPPAAP
jgi:hypothetical protein